LSDFAGRLAGFRPTAMRTNLPVQNVERRVAPDAMLVSTTDPEGRITYVNETFVEVSGFDADELLGAPQNIVRHPDMPAALFADLWRTIAAGLPWTAPLKNRCKDGSYYWVNANVMPLFDAGVLRGYISVRTHVDPEAATAAEALYAAMREGRTRARIVGGDVVEPGWRALRAWRRRLPLGLRMAIGVLVPPSLGGAALLVDMPMVAAWALGAVAAGACSLWLQTTVARPLGAMAETVRRIAAGELGLAHTVVRGDEIGRLQRLIGQLDANIVAMVGDVRRQVEGIHVSSAEIANGNTDLSGRTEASAANLQATAASMDQMTASVRQNAENAEAARRFVENAVAHANDSGQAATALQAMMRSVSDSAARIDEITRMIDTIAFQTNILALNASVEAARAGDSGRGFAVVADEVRNLARQAAEASGQIKRLVEETSTRITDGSAMVDGAVERMMGVVDEVRGIGDRVADISQATAEQAKGIESVHGAIAALDDSTSQNAALVEQSAAAAAELHAQADRLAGAAALFRLRRG
jgi:aerotaxis receptor